MSCVKTQIMEISISLTFSINSILIQWISNTFGMSFINYEPNSLVFWFFEHFPAICKKIKLICFFVSATVRVPLFEPKIKSTQCCTIYSLIYVPSPFTCNECSSREHRYSKSYTTKSCKFVSPKEMWYLTANYKFVSSSFITHFQNGVIVKCKPSRVVC